jgi:two-component system CheB/CheR fusion protein
VADKNNNFPIVGIGASAGGIEALESLFRAMPPDIGMAFVVVLHMPAGHDVSVPEILRRHSPLPVELARDGEAIAANVIYLCPGDTALKIVDRKFKISGKRGGLRPVDLFLVSLAEACGDDAVGIILSGAGSDGALGMKAIKERGGFTLAQGTEGGSPKQHGMPDTAIATGSVDLIVPVELMAEHLAEFADSARDVEAPAPSETNREENLLEARQEICRILQAQIGHDFSGYKEKTFIRRVRRRMQIVQTATLNAYIEMLRKEPEEVTLLFRDLLIGVTNFFRDKDAFQALQDTVVPRLFEGLGASDTVRVWVPGCATGEEVYSIAILMREHLNTLRNAPKVQIFATDIDDGALSIARAGRYPENLLESISPERLERFFTKDDSSYVITKEIRDLCIFSPHSVIRDPPFSRIDLISCRNLLIYLGTEFQGRVIPVFHFALRPGGYLFLGTSENIGQHSELFQRVDRKHRIFQRRDNVATPLQFPMFGNGLRARFGAVHLDTDRSVQPHAAASLRRVIETRVLDQFAPAHVVVNREGDIVHYSARTGKYLEAAAGTPSRHLLALARRGLRPELRTVLQEAMETRRPASRERIRVEMDDYVQPVNLMVEPIGDYDADPLFLVLFTDVGPPLPATGASGVASDATNAQLERELRDTRERLQATVEEYETALEELKAANEEMVSVNEELQSTNEELETSKEELQSVNEELQTVNLELNGKIDELDRANADLRNLFESTRIASIFLDGNLVIRSFTPAATSIFSLISTDRGRPLSDIVSTVDFGDLRRDVRMVIEQGHLIERKVRKIDDSAHYLMRVLPYRGRNNVVEGVIVTFVEVTKIVAAEEQQRTMIEELNHRVRNVLTVVNSIASQTLNRATSLKEFGEVFLGRVQAVAKSYSLLAREDWSPIALGDILQSELEPYRKGADGRITVSGPNVAFKPQAALALGMVFHELTTNAVKYGALSNKEGKVGVQWAIEPSNGAQRTVVLSWKESKGPTVKAPKKGGFGAELIDREVKTALKGSIARDYAATGLKIQMTLPLDGDS